MPNIKQEKSLQEKLKAFFRVGRTAGFPHPSSYELVLSAEQCEELGAGQPTPGRLRLLRDLGPQVREQRLQQHGPELLWYRIQDLLDPAQDRETRHTVLEFLEQLVLGQYNALDMMRPVLFSFLRDHRVEEDIEQKLQVLVALTENGKDIVHIEEQVGPFLLESLETVVGRGGGGEVKTTPIFYFATRMLCVFCGDFS